MKKITLTSLLIIVLTACGASSSATPSSSVTPPSSSATPTSSVTPSSSATPTSSVTPSSSETPSTSITPQQTVVPGQNLLEAREISTTNAITISHAYVFYNNPGRFVLGIATPEGTTSVDYDLEPYKSTNITFTSLTVGSYVTLSGFVTTMTAGAQARSKILRVNAEPVAVTSPNWIFNGFASAETIDMVSGFKTFANALTYNDLGAMYTFSNVRLLTVGTATLTGDGYDYFNFNGLSSSKNEVGDGPNFFRIGFFRFGLNVENFNATNVNYTLRVFLAGISQNLPGSTTATNGINIRLTGYVEVIQSQDVLPTAITLSPSSATDIILNSSLTVGAVVAPEEARNKNITWTSSDPAIASVTSGGVVTGLALGTTMITATSVALMTLSASVSITVVPIPITAQGVEFGVGDQNLKVGQSVTSNAALKPTNYVGQGITYTSSDEAVAKVTTAGVIQAWGAGTATITAAATENLELTDTLTVTVTDVDQISAIKLATATTLVTANGVITRLLSQTQFYIQNGEFGIQVFGNSGNTNLAEGEFVYVSGAVSLFNNIPQIVVPNVGALVATKIDFLTPPAISPLTINETAYGTFDATKVARIVTIEGLKPANGFTEIPSSGSGTRTLSLGSANVTLRFENSLSASDRTSLNSKLLNFWKNDTLTYQGILNGFNTTYQIAVASTNDFTLIEADEVPVTSVAVTSSNNETELTSNGTLQLVATVSPSNADVLEVTWSSSDSAVATVNPSGLVTGETEGNVRITATTQEPGSTISGFIDLIVDDTIILTDFTLAATTTLLVNETTQIVATPTPNAWIGAFTYISDDSSVVTVNETGLVTAFGIGNATITVTSGGDEAIVKTISFSVVAPTYASDLIISEVYEGASSNKYVEIFNGTGAAIDLQNYAIRTGVNGALFTTTQFRLSPSSTPLMLAHNNTVVVYNN